jgi:Undecaprenyl-phosphate glucose phosphotransferase
MPATVATQVIEDVATGPRVCDPLSDPPLLHARRRYRLSHDTLDLVPGALRFIDFLCLLLLTLYVYPTVRSTPNLGLWFTHFEFVSAEILSTSFLLQVLGLYRAEVFMSLGRTITAIVSGFLLLAAAMTLFSFVMDTLDYHSLRWAALWLGSGFLVFLGTRLALAQTIVALARRGILADSVAIVGGGPLADRLAAHLTKRHVWQPHRCPIEVVGIFDDRRERLPAGSRTVCGTLDDLIALGKEGAFQHVVLTLPWSAELRLLEIRQKLQALAINVSLCPDGYAFSTLSLGQSELGDRQFHLLAAPPLHCWSAITKRCEDIVLASLALLFFGPLMCLIALAVKLDSPGPALFRQRRHGFNNREIEVYKFRTMRTDMTDASGSTQACRGDTRVTRLGSVLRRTSIDELPQLLNVWMGDMSLVGPRPHPVGMKTQDKLCHEIVETYPHRHRVKPGITGWAQVNGYRGATSKPEHLIKRVEYDLYYIDNWSLVFDLQIMLKTVTSLISTENAF